VACYAFALWSDAIQWIMRSSAGIRYLLLSPSVSPHDHFESQAATRADFLRAAMFMAVNHFSADNAMNRTIK
jgi:hypothetical protein